MKSAVCQKVPKQWMNIWIYFFYYWDEMCVSEKANVSDIWWEFDVIQCQHHLNKRIFTIYAINFHDTHSKLAVVSQIFHYAFVWSMLIGTEKLLFGRKLFSIAKYFWVVLFFTHFCDVVIFYQTKNCIQTLIWPKKKPTKSLIKTLLLNTIK